MRKRLLVLALTLLLLCGTVTASAAGSASDPLVSKSYADSWANALVEEAADGIEAALRPAFQQSGQASGAARVSLSAGQVLSLKEGASVTLLSAGHGQDILRRFPQRQRRRRGKKRTRESKPDVHRL